MSCTTYIIVAQENLNKEFDNAIELLKTKQHKKASEAFTIILGKVTNNNEQKYCYIYRGIAYRDMQEYAKAIKDFDKAIELDPNDMASYIDRGETKTIINDLDGAIKDFEYITFTKSSDEYKITAYSYLSSIAFETNDFEQALAYLDKLIALTPNDEEAYFDRGAAKGMLMNWEGAIADYSKAIEINATFMEAFANRGVAKINQLNSKNKPSNTKEHTLDACNDLKTAKKMGDKSVNDMIKLYCGK